ncbi:MAG: hypothetical protein KME22_07720 [Hassallia sp. WJT32-NPBG1]|jgi:hypothetical protein|nr:hypothetical protein [Hassallia sp. WJT32-NPBG1]
MSLSKEINERLEKDGSGYRTTKKSAEDISKVCNSTDTKYIADVIQGISNPPSNRK